MDILKEWISLSNGYPQRMDILNELMSSNNGYPQRMDILKGQKITKENIF